MPEEDARDVSPAEAARELRGLARFEDALKVRTEGIVWALWGILNAGIFLSYALAGVLLGDTVWPFWAELLWAPWVAVGVATTRALWRSAALASPRLARPRAGFAAAAAWTLPVVAAWGVVAFAGMPVLEPVFALLVIGSVSLLVGAFDPLGYSPAGARIALASGVASVAAGLLQVLLGTDYLLSTLVGIGVPGVVLIGSGLFIATRG